MASFPEHKKSKEEFQGSEEDRISNLPDSLIGHIISFLPTEYALRTSVLSTKWKLNWTSTTNIDIDFDDHFCRSKPPFNRWNYVNFVNRVLQRCCVARMHKFRLKCIIELDFSHVNAWVTAVLERNVREFDFNIPPKGSDFVSRDLLTCGNLVVLKLGTRFFLNVPDSVCLPSLKILSLDTIEFLNDESLNRLYLGCPLLEELYMVGSVGRNISIVKISAPLLKRLIISNLCGDHYIGEVLMYKIVLDTPSLLCLEINDCFARSYSVQKLHHLVKAHIVLALPVTRFEYFPRSYNYGESVTVLLEAISEVQILHISGDLVEVIEECNPKLPMFHHATSFEIDDCVVPAINEWKTLLQLLDSLPHLETLVIAGRLIDWECYQELVVNLYPHQNAPSCLLFHLKVIEILDFSCEDELELVKYFLKNSRVLKKFTIDCTLHPDSIDLKLTEELMRLPRGSSCCHVEILSLDTTCS